VAGAAVAAELTEMLVILLVAADAILRGAHINPIHMAALTFDINMRTRQQESGLCVIEDVINPFRRSVAFATIDRKLAGMHIGLEVTSGAELRDPDPLPFDMAGFAIYRLMAGDQIECGELM
jgi:hypothetical protein